MSREGPAPGPSQEADCLRCSPWLGTRRRRGCSLWKIPSREGRGWVLPILAWMIAMMLDSAATASEIPIELDLGTVHHMEATALADGVYEITTSGDDPFIMTAPLPDAYDPAVQYVFSFDYFCPGGVTDVELFYGPPIVAGQSADGPEMLACEGWTSYSLNIRTCQKRGTWRGGFRVFRLDLGRAAGQTVQIRNIQLRTPNAHDLQQALEAGARQRSVAAVEEALRSMAASDFEAEIRRVEATDKTIRVTLNPGNSTAPLSLCEVPFHESVTGMREPAWMQAVASRGQQTVELERYRGGHDRVFSSWVLMRQTESTPVPASHQRFVDAIPSQWQVTRDRPRTKKGTVGLHGGNAFQIADYKALGIHNCTKNIVLPNLVRSAPGDDTSPHEFNGVTVHIPQAALERLDASMLEARDLDVVVSAIILIPKSTSMSHPDCTPQGIYAMANVVEKDGWSIYAGGLDFLAQRYTRPDRKYGRITHWILHNEVDAGWIWTNAGDIPLHTYMDLQYRSMRTAQSVIRRYGEAGDVLLSLTHHWTARHNARCYPPKAMVDLLARRCAQEGDFDWGLAYHPYPQNLRDPRTWLDKKVSFDFETPLITPKNIEVLDAYMRREPMLYGGDARTIVLSEQGSNSPGHDEKSYRDQAAGLAYTWLKIQDIESIESYVHHRWIDHPKEGGLNLGLRRRSNSTDPEESKKPAWDVYRKLGTPEQADVVEWLRTVIPPASIEPIPAPVSGAKGNSE